MRELKDEYVSTEHLLLSLAGHNSKAGEALRAAGASKDALLQAIAEVRGSHRVTDQSPEEKINALERFGRDLTEEAAQGKLDPVIGRDEEIRRVVQILSRRTKNNPLGGGAHETDDRREGARDRLETCAPAHGAPEYAPCA